MNKWPPLLDAAGNEIPVDTCACGRPKEARKAYCCVTCDGESAIAGIPHSNACNMRCATLGVPGFGVRATDKPVKRTLYIER